MARTRKLGRPVTKGGRRKTGRLPMPDVSGGRRRGILTNDVDGRQAIVPFTSTGAGSTRVLQEDGSFVAAAALTGEAGYWSPLIMDGENNGDAEFVLTDDNQVIAVWTPTP